MVTRVDLLLVNTPLRGAGTPGCLYPSLANLTLGSFVSRAGWSVALLDPTVDLDSVPPEAMSDPRAVLRATAEAVVAARPRVLGLTTMGHTEGSFAVALAREVRCLLPDLPIVLGGSWATGYADLVLDRFPFIDGVALGSGEHPLAMAHDRGLGSGGHDHTAGVLASTPGWLARAGDRIMTAGPAERLRPEDSPRLDLSLLAHPDRYDTMVYLTSRGCPFRCVFCTEPFMFDRQMNEPIDKVAADLAAFGTELDVGYLWLCDPLFGASRDRLRELLPLLARGATGFLFESRVDKLDPEAIPDIRAAGGDLVYLGLEAASTRSLLQMRKVAGKRDAARYRDKARAVVEACAASDVLPVLGVLNPVPGDTPADIDQTIDFLAELDALARVAGERAGTHIRPFFYAFPYRVDRGTEAARTWDTDAGAHGCTTNVGEDDLFTEREILDASTTVDRVEAAAFRQWIRDLNRGGPDVMKRALRSMPRPFLTARWMPDSDA
jgi:hypothetical protein